MPRTLKTIIKISRPRFWLYTAGTFAVGFAAGAHNISDFYTLEFFYCLFFFFIPANIFLYGVNDLFDWETDHFNIKKNTKEYLMQNSDKKLLKMALLFSLLLSAPLFFIFFSYHIIWLLLFLLLSFFYSAEPVRFKKRPVLDFASNFLYVIPGIFGFLLNSTHLNFILVFGLFCWTSAMHLFSAVPDIEPDTKAKIRTTAVVLGYRNSLLLCILFWSIFAFIFLYSLKSFLLVVLLIYVLLPSILLISNKNKNNRKKSKIKIEKVYWLFPYINGVLGGMVFWYILLKNLL